MEKAYIRYNDIKKDYEKASGIDKENTKIKLIDAEGEYNSAKTKYQIAKDENANKLNEYSNEIPELKERIKNKSKTSQ